MKDKNEALFLLKTCSRDSKQLLVKIVQYWDKKDNEVIFWAMQKAKSISAEFEHQLFYESIYKHAEERYAKIIQPHMVFIDAQTFWMGSSIDSDMLYCGEIPRHKVDVGAFEICEVPITNEMYSNFCNNKSINCNLPVVDITWFDAYIFGKWVNCSLPTEAEWELASGRIETTHWCCEQNDLGKYAWYSENSSGYIHEVCQKMPNNNGLYDMHGNVWEWVLDDYNENYYHISERKDPCCWRDDYVQYKVCRGGSIHAFSEMCRCEFRYYEPPDFKTKDLGFRIVKRKYNSLYL